MSIQLRNVNKKFEDYSALENINFEIKEGELVSLLGPSGSGKTTLLRIIAGLETPDKGEILFHNNSTNSIPVRERNIGFVFQHYALFRHMTVEDNIGFSLKIKGVKSKIRKERVDELLDLVQLKNLAHRYPAQLSGGQKQRVALARALASKPSLLLLDEPFGALDANVRKDLRKWLRNLHKEISTTTIMVTHDQEEAFEVSDKVVILNKGKLQQIGKPDDVFHNPSNPFVMKFLGNVNIFHGRIESGFAYLGGLSFELNESQKDQAKLYVRPHEWDISFTNLTSGSIESEIQFINAASSIVKIDVVSIHGEELQVDIPYEKYKTMGLKKGMKVFLTPKEAKLFVEDYVI
ncbi:MAG: sulfate/molybdate ABC transporter ATP-binding protein [Leptospiraceae bacterium]|nr:sulfate/molybdate ABC transporter ATP-binding protein [Leptospiraceae bacterium]